MENSMRPTSFRRAVLMTVATAALITSSGCFGSFNVTRKVYGFNKTVSTNKFARELVFLAFNIVPVYGVAGFADVIVVNSVEFWTGKNPVALTTIVQVDKDTRIERVVSEKRGTRFMTIKVFKSNKRVSTTTMKMAVGGEDLDFETVLASGARVAQAVRMADDGSAVVLGANSRR
jgi:hypothetical protein